MRTYFRPGVGSAGTGTLIVLYRQVSCVVSGILLRFQSNPEYPGHKRVSPGRLLFLLPLIALFSFKLEFRR